MALIGHSTAIALRHHQVVIQGYTDSGGDSGFPIEAFTDLATVMAAREPLFAARGAERFAEEQVSARSYHRWTMPYHEAIDPDRLSLPKMRLLYDGRAYDIVEAHVIHMRAEIVLTTMVQA